MSLCASASTREGGGWQRFTNAVVGPLQTTRGQGLRIKPGGTRLVCFSVRVSLAWIEPVGFRVESDLRNHQAIVQPRLYDCLMVTQITLKTERFHGFPSDRLPAEVDPPDGEVLFTS